MIKITSFVARKQVNLYFCRPFAKLLTTICKMVFTNEKTEDYNKCHDMDTLRSVS